jgi:prepilin-type N-terminal cleavage/methylation domain-containing protein
MKRAGFTLIELSIVLVIIGLIIGGVLVGRDLIRAAEVRATVAQKEKFDAAVHTFKGKYGYLPGDIFPATAASYGFFQLTATCGGALCDGFGNGRISYSLGTTNTGYNMNEVYAFWRHLGEANLIPGTYGTNASNGINTDGNPQTNPNSLASYKLFVPEAPMKGHVWVAGGTVIINNGNGAFAAGPGHAYSLENAAARPSSAYMSPVNAYAIDSKIDDGMPTTGTVLEFGGAFDGMWNTTPTEGLCTYGGAAMHSVDARYNINPAIGGNANACYLQVKASF